jgi:hypothetical protein
MVSLEPKLPAILNGDVNLNTPAERLALAQMCYDKNLQAAAARFWTEAFESDAKLADEVESGNRYNAACAAALAGAGKSKDDPAPNDIAKAKLREQALNWLKADLAYWIKQLESGSPQSKSSANQTLQHWKTDPDLAGIRDVEALKRLPEDEQKSLRAFWTNVDATLERASTAGPHR